MSQEPSRPITPPLPGDRPARPGADHGPSRPVDPQGAPARPHRSTAEVLGAVVGVSGVAIAAVLGSAWLALLSAAAVLFGLGLVVVLALAALGVVLLVRRPGARGWLVVPLLAVALPAAGVAATGTRVERQHGVEVHAPRTAADLPRGGWRTGLGAQLVDLRHLELPAGRVVDVSARSDLDRTVVALPHDRCWNVEVRWRTGGLWLPGVSENPWVDGLGDERAVHDWARRRRDGYVDPSYGRIALFGRVQGAAEGSWSSYVADPDAPTVRIALRSLGSSFVVRDYPDAIPPLVTPEWPQTVQPPASPGELRVAWSSPGRSRASARAWRRYRAERTAFTRLSTRLMDGGCGRKVVQR